MAEEEGTKDTSADRAMNLSTDDGVASEYHSEEKRNLRTLVGQYAFFAEELSAQSAIVEKISGRALDAPTVDGSPSIGERYKKLLHRERENSAVLNAFLGDGRGLGIPNGKDDRRDASAGATLSEAAALRAACARALEGLREEEWSESILGSDESASLSAWLYRIVLDDAEELQAIGILFSEQAVTFLDRI
jgi:hypothetical protein